MSDAYEQARKRLSGDVSYKPPPMPPWTVPAGFEAPRPASIEQAQDGQGQKIEDLVTQTEPTPEIPGMSSMPDLAEAHEPFTAFRQAPQEPPGLMFGHAQFQRTQGMDEEQRRRALEPDMNRWRASPASDDRQAQSGDTQQLARQLEAATEAMKELTDALRNGIVGLTS